MVVEYVPSRCEFESQLTLLRREKEIQPYHCSDDVIESEKPNHSETCEKTRTQSNVSNTSFLPRDATEEEIESLPHITDRIPLAAWVVVLAEAAERSTYFSIIAPWRTFIRHLLGYNEV
jgi:hypothetical protein